MDFLDGIRDATPRTYESFDDEPCTFYDVLKGFAENVHGYGVTSIRPMWSYFYEQSPPRGHISYQHETIYVQAEQSPTVRTAVLAHEISHLYTRATAQVIAYSLPARTMSLDHLFQMEKACVEVVTDAAAAGIMQEYGYDTLGLTHFYVLVEPLSILTPQDVEAVPFMRWFREGKLDVLAQIAYHDYSADLRAYVEG